MITHRKISTEIMLILIFTFGEGNQYRTRRNFLRLFEHIQFLGPSMVLDIKVTARMIDKGNSSKEPACLLCVGCP